MKLTTIYSIFFSLLAFALISLFSGYSFGPAATAGMGYTGESGESGTTCGTCHNADAFGAVSVDLVSNIGTLPYEFLPEVDVPMDITINAASGSPGGYGFQLIMTNSVGVPLDIIYSNLGTNVKQTTLPNGRTYLEHNGISANNVFSFDYNIVPSSNVDAVVKVYVAAVAVDANGFNSGDSGSAGFEFTLLRFELPVELTNFEATPQRTGVQLDWTTETEQNNDYFAIEHSTNGINFTSIKTIMGAGTTDERHTYTYTHRNPVNGDNYYQLRQVDFDGKGTLSEVVVAKFGSKSITAFPQPATEHATIYVNAAVNESAMLQVHDLMGRMIHAENVNLMSGENLIDMNCSQWASGHYVISISGAQLGEEVTRFTVR